MKTLKVVFTIIFVFFIFLFISLIYDSDCKKIGDDFLYNAENKHIVGNVDIPPTIISYDYDKHFIIAKQKPKAYNEAIYDKMEYIYPLGRDTIYYWLIIKQEQKVIGPLDYDSFLKLKNEYRVPDALSLQ